MSLSGKDHTKEELDIIEHLVKENARLVGMVDRLACHKPLHHFVAFFFVHHKQSKFLLMSLTLNPGQTDVVGIQVIDSISGVVLSKAVLSGETYAVDNAAAVGAVPDANPAQEDLTAVAVGTANLNGTVTADLSAYGLGKAVVLPVTPAIVNVVPAVTIAPQAQFVFAPPVTPAAPAV